MRLTFLGTGTSFGVPVLGCHCAVCSSTDPRDRRLRTSALVETEDTRLLIDAGPDLRAQLLPLPFRPISGVLLTHHHYDHVGGLDDLRPYSRLAPVSLFASATTAAAVRTVLPYCFTEHLYPGVPRFSLHTVEAHQRFRVGAVEVEPIPILHGQMPILGYRIGGLLYLTDVKTVAPEELHRLRKEGVDTLVVSALRWDRPTHSHIVVPDALELAKALGARVTWLTHLTHDIGLTDEANARLPHGVRLAEDGLSIEVPY